MRQNKEAECKPYIHSTMPRAAPQIDDSAQTPQETVKYQLVRYSPILRTEESRTEYKFHITVIPLVATATEPTERDPQLQQVSIRLSAVVVLGSARGNRQDSRTRFAGVGSERPVA